MRRKIVGVLLLCICCIVAACAEKPVAMPNAKEKNVGKKLLVHGDSSASPAAPRKMLAVESLKKNSLYGYPQKPVGEAFDAYSNVMAKEWKEGLGRDNKFYVDYIGWFAKNSVPPAAQQAGVVQWGIDVKFAVNEDGKTYITMITKLLLMKDGTIKTDFFAIRDEQVVDAIYSGKELTF